MQIPERKNFNEAIAPLIYFSCAMGLGIPKLSRSRIVHNMLILYSLGIWIIMGYTFYLGIKKYAVNDNVSNSPLFKFAYEVIFYLDFAMALSMPLLAIKRHKGLNDIIKQIQKVDDIFATMLGIQANYKREFILQIYFILIICIAIISVVITDVLTLGQDRKTAVALFIAIGTFYHPVLLMLIADFSFISYVRYLGKKFGNINTALLNLVEPSSNFYPKVQSFTVAERITKFSGIYELGNIKPRSPARKLYLLQIIRRSHLNLSKTAGKLNLLFGIQNLISMGGSLVVITCLLYAIYCMTFGPVATMEEISNLLIISAWCFVFSTKIFMVSHVCATVSDEAGRSGQIIYELIEPTIASEVHKEIQEFALQMIQNPVKFTASGFFTLDHTYIQGVIGSITTYLVILIQMSSAPSTQPTASTERTSN